MPTRRIDPLFATLIGLLLVTITLVAYWPALNCGFLETYDDHFYITGNQPVMRGLSADGVTWALKSLNEANWHPLTWMSHMLDCRLYGLNPRGHHLTNLLFHLANLLLLFGVMTRMTGSLWRSGFVAALFAVHPLHVESVAWVAERKDVLSTFFWLLTMLAYLSYAKRPSLVRYVPVVLAYALGLMAKPMLVTLPFMLLLMDYWPLDRMSLRWKLVWEKAPLLALSTASCVVTLIAQRQGGAVITLDSVPFVYRACNAAVSYVWYAAKMVWPSDLSVFYPYPPLSTLPAKGIAAMLLLVAVTVLALRVGRTRRYVTFGWLWYLVTLVPVIGLVQVGGQAMADRYAYIPLTGLLVIAVWGVSDMVGRSGTRAKRGASADMRVPLTASALLLILVLASCTHTEVELWRDDYTLFSRAIEIQSDNYLALGAVGEVLRRQGDYQGAIGYLARSVAIFPRYPRIQVNLGVALVKTGRVDEGFEHLNEARRLGLEIPEVHYNLAYGHWLQSKPDAAKAECDAALKLDPTYPPAHNLLGAILDTQGRPDDAIEHWKTSAEHDPTYPDPHSNLAAAYAKKGDYRAAWREIHLFEKLGRAPTPSMVEALSLRMPDPGD